MKKSPSVTQPGSVQVHSVGFTRKPRIAPLSVRGLYPGGASMADPNDPFGRAPTSTLVVPMNRLSPLSSAVGPVVPIAGTAAAPRRARAPATMR